MSCLLTMTRKRKKNMTKPVCFEWEHYGDEDVTVVALEATLDDFKAQPITIDGKPFSQFKERTIKDCRMIDKCIYLHLGHINDDKMTDLIQLFHNVIFQAKKIGPHGSFWMQDGKILPSITK